MKYDVFHGNSIHDKSQRVCRRDRQTDGQTPDRYITLFARQGQRITIAETLDHCFSSHSLKLRPRQQQRRSKIRLSCQKLRLFDEVEIEAYCTC